MSFFQPRILPLTVALLCVPSIVSAQTVTRIEPLSTVRSQIVFPELTAAEKQTLAQQAQVFLRDLYVHRYHKPLYYFGQSDPGVAIEKIVKDVDKLSTKELETALYRLFCQQRDLHLNYIFPSPHSKYTSFLPLTFQRTAGRGNYFEVRVNAVNQAQFETYAPGQRVPAVGDQVVSFNGNSIYLEILKMLPISQGANEFGGFTRAIQTLASRSHRLREVPEQDTVKMTFKAYAPTGRCEYYTITVPWLTRWTEAAPGIAPASRSLAKERIEKEIPLVKRFNYGVDLVQEEYNKFIQANGLEGATVWPSNPTAERELTWGKIANANGNFGYIRLNSFSTATGPVNTVAEVRRLLMTELAGTDGLIFDVRNNGGGAITLADTLPQLFTKKDAQVLDFRLLNNDLNYRLYNETSWGTDENFKKIVNDAHGNGKLFTGLAQFTTDGEANVIGQVYYKPVAVMANARSYSATDMFTTSMQDNGGGIIFGEDPKTGAGGANVIEHAYFNQYGPADVFQKLPGDHAMRVSWRQTIRFAPNAGKVIEDYGCSADVDISQTVNDVITGGETQLATVTKKLAQLSMKYKAAVRGEGSASEIFLPRVASSYGVFAKNTPGVNVYLNGELRDRITVNAGETEAEVRYTLPGDLEGGKAHRLAFVGVDRRGHVLWNLKRNFTILENKVVLDANGFKADFATATTVAPLTILNQGAATAETGWKLVNPNLQIGFTPNYADNLDTDTILFLDLKNRTSAKLEFGLEYDTEEGWDFVDVYVTDNTNKSVLLSVSGKKEMGRYAFDLTPFAGKDNVAVHVRFTSDSNTNATGVKLSDITVQ